VLLKNMSLYLVAWQRNKGIDLSVYQDCSGLYVSSKGCIVMFVTHYQIELVHKLGVLCFNEV